jgi:hypothetical protein
LVKFYFSQKQDLHFDIERITNMKRRSFLSRASRTTLRSIVLSLTVAAALSATSLAQEPAPVDLRLYGLLTPVVGNPGEVQTHIQVSIESRREANNAVLTAELSEGVVVSSVQTDVGECAYTGNLVTCNLGKVGVEGQRLIDAAATISIRARPAVSGTVTLTARITASEPDPNLSNNTITDSLTVNLPKSRKRVRFF